jgi:hypothetical protein
LIRENNSMKMGISGGCVSFSCVSLYVLTLVSL